MAQQIPPRIDRVFRCTTVMPRAATRKQTSSAPTIWIRRNRCRRCNELGSVVKPAPAKFRLCGIDGRLRRMSELRLALQAFAKTLSEGASPDIKYPKNNRGGIDPIDSAAKAVAKRVDLITLPPGVSGTNCANCKYARTVKGGHFCEHKDVQQPITPRMCCALWDNQGVQRPF